jgi:uncharacterized RDD family membrane protein YckC
MSEDKSPSTPLPQLHRCEITGEKLPSSELVYFRGRWVGAKGKLILLERIQSGESLDTGLATPSMGRRLKAFCLDAATLCLPIFTGFIVGFGSGTRLFVGMVSLLLFLMVTAYFGFPIANTGQSWGKRTAGIKIVTRGGESVGSIRALIRAALLALPFAAFSAMAVGAYSPTILFVGFIGTFVAPLIDALCMLLDVSQRRALHEILSGTRSVLAPGDNSDDLLNDDDDPDDAEKPDKDE